MSKMYPNDYDSSYEELLSYAAVWQKGLLELDAVWQAEGRALDGLKAAMDNVIDNQFVLTADEPTITLLEQFLMLRTDRSRSLEERRRIVLSIFAGSGKMSASRIKEMISVFTDAPIEVRFEPGDEEGNNFVYIEIGNGERQPVQLSDINSVLRKRIPAHLYFILMLLTTCTLEISIGINFNSYKQTDLGVLQIPA